MKERIKILRKQLGLTLEKFGSALCVQSSAVSKWERGENSVPEQMIKLICHECWNGNFVSEVWLRDGIGNMFIELPEEDEIGGLVSDLIEDIDNPFYKMIVSTMRTFKKLTPENQKVLITYCKQVFEDFQEKED